MQVGQTENFDKIMQVNEQKEKHRRPDASKPTDVQCTKNLLRNLNQTMLRFLHRSKISKNMMIQHFKDHENVVEEIEKFKKWALSQKMDNFQQCRNLWIYDETTPNYEYLKLFREIQFEFFSNSSCPAVFYSKVRNQESKRTHLKYISSFLEGIVYPTRFTCFKKSNKLKEQEKVIQQTKSNNSSGQSSPRIEQGRDEDEEENSDIEEFQQINNQKEEYQENEVYKEDKDLIESDEDEKQLVTIELKKSNEQTGADASSKNQNQETIEL